MMVYFNKKSPEFFVVILCSFGFFSNKALCDTTCDNIDIEETLRKILAPTSTQSDESTMQLQALRKDLLKKFQEALEKATEDEDEENSYKRSLSSLAAYNNLPESSKRNVEALARAGYIRTLPEDEEKNDEENDSNYKRSLASLAKNGQLPIRIEDEKRGIESLARNGELYPRTRQNIQEMLEELYLKRNLGSLARNNNFNLPASNHFGKRFVGSLARSGDLNYKLKRNIATLARDGALLGKRNVAALLRQDSYLNAKPNMDVRTDMPQIDKRNIASIKAHPKYKRSDDRAKQRAKRQVDYFPTLSDEEEDLVEAPGHDYDELINELNQETYPIGQKRFLGSVARSGWFRPAGSRLTRFSPPDKRHIGSLARLGWLPTLRSIRRFNRSGRSADADFTECSSRPLTSNGKTKNYPVSKNAIPLDDKRFLLQPAVERILLRKMFMHPMRTTRH